MGWTEKRIARHLGTGRDTVAEHLCACRRTLGAANNAQLVAEATAHGFLPIGHSGMICRDRTHRFSERVFRQN